MADGDYERREGRLAEIKRLDRLIKDLAGKGKGYGREGHARQVDAPGKGEEKAK